MLPGTIYRVEYLEGFGWPKCERTEKTHRTYEYPRDVVRMVDEIERLPEHHKLLSVSKGTVKWAPVNVNELREPDTKEPVSHE